MTKKKTPKKKKVMLAMQGGGAFGAFTWGVLDRLLEDERIEISAISGTSAGAMNAVAIAHGLAENGNEGARDTLRNLWNSLAYDEAVKQMPYVGTAGSKSNRALAKMFKQLMPETAAGDFMKSLKAVTQGATLSVLNGRAGLFESALEKVVDFAALKKNKKAVPLFIAATDVNAHKERIFDRSDITSTAVKASCALPVVIGEVEIDGRKYLDGGYTANPAIAPLKECDSNDLLIIQTIEMHERDGLATIDSSIDRMMEFTNNASLRRDLEDIDRDNKLVAKDPDAAAALGIKEIHTHVVKIGQELKAEHMLCFDRDHLDELFDAGRQAADDWLAQHFDDLGKKSSFTRERAMPPSMTKKRRGNTPK